MIKIVHDSENIYSYGIQVSAQPGKSIAEVENETELQRFIKIHQVKKMAGEKIVALIPGATRENFQTKELNLLARMGELLNLKIDGKLGDTPELDELNILWSKIAEIRTASNSIEESVKADLDYDIETGWPEEQGK